MCQNEKGSWYLVAALHSYDSWGMTLETSAVSYSMFMVEHAIDFHLA